MLQERPDGVVGQGQRLADIGHVDAVAHHALALELFYPPVGLAPGPRFFDALGGTVAELGRGGEVENFLGVAQQHQRQSPRGAVVVGSLPQVTGQLVEASAEGPHLVAGIGGAEEEDMACRVEVAVAVVGMVAAGVVCGGEVVAGKDGAAVGTARAIIGGAVRALPGIETAVAKNFSAAGRAALVDVDEVGAGHFGGGQLPPQRRVVERQPVVDGRGVGIGQGFVPQSLALLAGRVVALQRPTPWPTGAVAGCVLAQLVEIADLDCGAGAGLLLVDGELVVAALIGGAQVEEPGAVAATVAAVQLDKTRRCQRQRVASRLDGQPQSPAAQKQPGAPGNAQGHGGVSPRRTGRRAIA